MLEDGLGEQARRSPCPSERARFAQRRLSAPGARASARLVTPWARASQVDELADDEREAEGDETLEPPRQGGDRGRGPQARGAPSVPGPTARALRATPPAAAIPTPWRAMRAGAPRARHPSPQRILLRAAQVRQALWLRPAGAARPSGPCISASALAASAHTPMHVCGSPGRFFCFLLAS